MTADGSFRDVDGWDHNALMRVTPASLASGGKPSRLNGSGAHLFAADPQGNLWSIHDGVLRRYPAGSWTNALPAKPAAEFALTTEGDASVPPNGLVFNSTGRPISRADAASNGWAAIDQNGDLWLPDENSEVVQISKSLLAKGGADAPLVGIKYPGATAP